MLWGFELGRSMDSGSWGLYEYTLILLDQQYDRDKMTLVNHHQQSLVPRRRLVILIGYIAGTTLLI
jgi:hypothetical protein